MGLRAQFDRLGVLGLVLVLGLEEAGVLIPVGFAQVEQLLVGKLFVALTGLATTSSPQCQSQGCHRAGWSWASRARPLPAGHQ